jgi:hypothetical protein
MVQGRAAIVERGPGSGASGDSSIGSTRNIRSRRAGRADSLMIELTPTTSSWGLD